MSDLPAPPDAQLIQALRERIHEMECDPEQCRGGCDAVARALLLLAAFVAADREYADV